MILYHGTDVNFKHFDLERAGIQKDFGRGMYLATTHTHAKQVAYKKNGSHAYVKYYDIDFENLTSSLRVKNFKKVSVPWVKYVIANRIFDNQIDVDVVIGATADADAQDKIENFYY